MMCAHPFTAIGTGHSRMTGDGTERDPSSIGSQLYDCVVDLYPICRSITGDGVRQTLARLGRIVPLTVHEVPTGTAVFDWIVPREWNIRDAFVKDAAGTRVIDFRASNLHVLNYSRPIREIMSLESLRPHLYTLPDKPDWIPYRTSYYEENWGFCLSQRQFDALADGDYEVVIDATLEPGSLSYGEFCIPGESEDEVLVSCHVCHPSLANDNLSGIAVAAFAARYLQTRSNRLTYRFLFIPATIGSLAWLAQNESALGNIRHGLVLANLGDDGPLTYKRSRRGNATIDRAAVHVLRQLDQGEIFDFSPYGYDERQYCSPGFDLPVGRLSRTPHGCFPEYHSSADNLDFVSAEQLAASLQACIDIFAVLEKDRVYLNQKPRGEPQLSKYGLYDAIGGGADAPSFRMAMLWMLSLSDGEHSLLDIAEQADLNALLLAEAAKQLCDHELLKAQ